MFKHCKSEKEQDAKWEIILISRKKEHSVTKKGSAQMGNSGNRSHEKSRQFINSVYFSKSVQKGTSVTFPENCLITVRHAGRRMLSKIINTVQNEDASSRNILLV